MNKQARGISPHGKRAESLKAWLIMLPGLLLMSFFVWEPLLESIRMSLYKTENIELVEFVGLRNFISVMGKTNFTQALANTFAYTFWSLLIGFFLPILLAMLIGETVRGKGFFRTAAYLPNMLPGLAVIILWSAFFSGEKSGVLNILLSRVGVPRQSFHILRVHDAAARCHIRRIAGHHIPAFPFSRSAGLPQVAADDPYTLFQSVHLYAAPGHVSHLRLDLDPVNLRSLCLRA